MYPFISPLLAQAQVEPTSSLLADAGTIIGLVTGIHALLILIGIVVARYLATTNSFRLVRETFRGQARGSRWEAAKTLAGALWFRARMSLQDGKKAPTIYESVRIRIEHELIHGDHIDHQSQEWRAYLSKAFGDRTIGDTKIRGDQPLTAGDVNKGFVRITRYFEALKDLKTDTADLKFLCTLTIDTGFVSPLHLLGGMISRFESEWYKVVAAYNKDVADEPWPDWVGELPEGRREWTKVFRRVQKFTFDCWLQWGPSIPNSISDSINDHPFTSVQYGFGDENNSIEIVADRRN